MTRKKSRYPRVIEKGKCRGCGEPVPKGRFTWCSDDCRDPHTVLGRHFVLRRDKVCQICGLDILKALDDWRKNLQVYFPGGYRQKIQQPTYEIDHIIPFSEGGKTTYPNLRLLCTPCHKSRTKAWHLSRRKSKTASQMELVNL